MTGPQTIDELHDWASRPNDRVLDALRAAEGDILVIGAGGKMGFHLSAMLRRGLSAIESPHRLIAISRFGTAGATDWFDRYAIDTARIDLLDDAQFSQLPDAAHVFFLVGVKFGTANDATLLRRVNVELPVRVADRYHRSTIVALSTGCVYPFAAVDGGGSTEHDPVGPVGEYAISCVGREQAFFDSTPSTSIVRLNYSVDLRYGVLVDIAQRVLDGQRVDETTGHFNVIWQGDALAYIIAALGHTSVPPFVLNVTGRSTLAVRAVAERFGQLFGRPVTLSGDPAPTAWLSSARKCHELFGPPAVDEWELVEWVANWLSAGGETLGKPTHFEVRDGNF